MNSSSTFRQNCCIPWFVAPHRQLSVVHDLMRRPRAAAGSAQLLQPVSCPLGVWPAPHPARDDAGEQSRKFRYLHLARHGFAPGSAAPDELRRRHCATATRWSLAYTYLQFQQTVELMRPESAVPKRDFARAGVRSRNGEAEGVDRVFYPADLQFRGDAVGGKRVA